MRVQGGVIHRVSKYYKKGSVDPTPSNPCSMLCLASGSAAEHDDADALTRRPDAYDADGARPGAGDRASHADGFQLVPTTLYGSDSAFWMVICGCPIWDLPFVPARYDAEFRGRLLGPRDFSLPLAGVTAHVRPAARAFWMVIPIDFRSQ